MGAHKIQRMNLSCTKLGPMKRRLAAVALIPALFATACAADSVQNDSSDSSTISIGSQDYYSNEIVAEIYAQALEEAGFEVEREFRIGQREVYLPDVESGTIDLMPEYSGALLQYFDPETDARSADDVYDALVEKTPENLQVLDQAEANDQDAYVVRGDDPANSIADLAGREGLVLGGNSEITERPFGPDALEKIYGVSVAFTPIEDSGGPLTVNALRGGDIDVANIYTGSPALEGGDLKVLEDPENIFVASHIVPLATADLDQEAADIINDISAKLSQEDLLALNSASVNEQQNAATIASRWLADNA